MTEWWFICEKVIVRWYPWIWGWTCFTIWLRNVWTCDRRRTVVWLVNILKCDWQLLMKCSFICDWLYFIIWLENILGCLIECTSVQLINIREYVIEFTPLLWLMNTEYMNVTSVHDWWMFFKMWLNVLHSMNDVHCMTWLNVLHNIIIDKYIYKLADIYYEDIAYSWIILNIYELIKLNYIYFSIHFTYHNFDIFCLRPLLSKLLSK